MKRALTRNYLAKDGKSQITVRRATISDIPVLIRNFQKVADEGIYVWTEQVSKEQRRGIENRLGNRRSLMLVAVFDEQGKKKMVGNLTLATIGTAKKSSHVRSLSMSVIDGYRESGVGNAMMDCAIDWARKTRGVEKISLSVFSSNKRAIGLYKKFGFQIEGILKRAFVIRGKYVDEIEMGLFVKN
jgi:RimJ/RimL family protein N-acetyltransferase